MPPTSLSLSNGEINQSISLSTWPQTLSTTALLLGPILALTSVLSRFCTRKFRLLLNLFLFLPALCIPLALLFLGPDLRLADAADEVVATKGEELERRMLLLGIVVEIWGWWAFFEGEGRRVWIVRGAIFGLGVVGWVLVVQAVAVADAASVAVDLEPGSRGAVWADVVLYGACWVGVMGVLVVRVVRVRREVSVDREERCEEGKRMAGSRETDALLGNGDWEWDVALPRE